MAGVWAVRAGIPKGQVLADLAAGAVRGARLAGAYTRPLVGSTSAHFVVEYVGCMISPQSIRQGNTGRCDQNG